MGIWCQGSLIGEVEVGEKGLETSGTSSGWGRCPRHTAPAPAPAAAAGSGGDVLSANLTSRPRRKDVVRRGGLRRKAAAGAGCKLADDACGSSRGGCAIRPNGDCRRNCRATTGCQYDVDVPGMV